MKLTCDLCGGMLQMSSGGQGAVCKDCGMGYTMERLREKLAQSRAARNAGAAQPAAAPAEKPAPAAAPAAEPAPVKQPEAAPAAKPDSREDIRAEAIRAGKFTMILRDVFTISGSGVAATGCVEGGAVSAGARVRVNNGKTCSVSAIVYNETVQRIAQPGMNIGVILDGLSIGDVSVGDVLVQDGGVGASGANGARVPLEGRYISASDFAPVGVPEQFVMNVEEVRQERVFCYLCGTVRQGGLSRLDSVYLNYDMKKRYEISHMLSSDEYGRGRPYLQIKLCLEKCPKAMLNKTMIVTGDLNPTISLDHYGGPAKDYFASLLVHTFRDYDICMDATFGEDATPADFVLCRNGQPKLALFLAHSHDSHTRSRGKRGIRACEKMNVTGLQFFGDYRNDRDYVIERIRSALLG